MPPVDESTAPTVPATPVRLEEGGAHDRDTLAARLDPPPEASPAVRRQAPGVGAGWIDVHVRIGVGVGSNALSYRDQWRGAAALRRTWPTRKVDDLTFPDHTAYSPTENASRMRLILTWSDSPQEASHGRVQQSF